MEYREKDYPIPGRWQLGEWKFDRCPKCYVTENVQDWFIAYEMFKNGFLPNDGGWLKQSNKFIQVVTFLSTQIRAHEKQQAVKNGK